MIAAGSVVNALVVVVVGNESLQTKCLEKDFDGLRTWTLGTPCAPRLPRCRRRQLHRGRS